MYHMEAPMELKQAEIIQQMRAEIAVLIRTKGKAEVQAERNANRDRA